MRIISGKNRGRHIVAPDNLPVRPTTDLGKERFVNWMISDDGQACIKQAGYVPLR